MCPDERLAADYVAPRPRLLDLFCGAGGCSMGYHRAGFDVVGVDIKRQKNYPFEFHQADALEFPLDGFDAIHASPPCQAYSVTRHTHTKEHPELVAPTRERLVGAGVPWIMENVIGAPMPSAIVLCGASFGLHAYDPATGLDLWLKRHRYFESSNLFMPPPCACKGKKIGGVYGGGPENRSLAGSHRIGGGYTPAQPVRAELMGIAWMNQQELTQAIPPAYTEWIGLQLLDVLAAAA